MPHQDLGSDDSARPLAMLGLTILLVVVLLAASGGDPAPASPDGSVRIRSGGGGGAGVLSVPNAPVNGLVNDPVPHRPTVGIIEDVRDTMNRLPLDRNTPKGWSNPRPR